MKSRTRVGQLALTFLIVLFCSNGLLAQNKTSTEAFEISTEDLKEYVGQYDPEPGQFFSVTLSLDGDKLMAQPTDKRQPLTLLTTLEKDKFLMRGPGITFAFKRNDKDEIETLVFSQNGRSFTVKKKKE